MGSRKIEEGHPALQLKIKAFLEAATAAGIDVLITDVYRGPEEQNALFAKGRTAPGHIVTNAKAGQSRHNDTLNGKAASTAFDVVPRINGQLIWDAKHPHWAALGKIGEGLGLEWAGRWTKFREYPHFQLPAKK